MTDLREKIYDMLEDICECDEIRDNPDLELIDSNILDSLSFILLLERLDDELDIEIQPTQVDLNVFKTPASIVSFIENI